MKATWNGAVVADSDETIVVEGNHYFPKDSVSWELLTPTDTSTVCHWKGTASYWTITVDGQSNKDAAWSYPQPKPEAAQIADYVAFWRGVTVL